MVVVVDVEFVKSGGKAEEGEEEMLRGERGKPEADSGGAVPVRRVAGRDVELRVGKGMRMEALVALDVWKGSLSESGKVAPVGVAKVLYVPFSVGKGMNPVADGNGLNVTLTEGKGRRAEAVAFKIGGGKRPDMDALKLVVKFTVGNGKRPDLGEVELVVGRGKKPDKGSVVLAVEFTVGKGMRPDLGAVGYTLKLRDGMERLGREAVR